MENNMLPKVYYKVVISNASIGFFKNFEYKFIKLR